MLTENGCLKKIEEIVLYYYRKYFGLKCSIIELLSNGLSLVITHILVTLFL